MTIFSFLNGSGRPSGEIAKKRLKNVLDAQHSNMSGADAQALRRDMQRVLESYFVLEDSPMRVSIVRRRQKDGSYLRDVRIEAKILGVRRMAIRF